jgi:hypothetical protein
LDVQRSVVLENQTSVSVSLFAVSTGCSTTKNDRDKIKRCDFENDNRGLMTTNDWSKTVSAALKF